MNVAKDRNQRRHHHLKALISEEFKSSEAGQSVVERDQGPVSQMQGDIHATTNFVVAWGAS